MWLNHPKRERDGFMIKLNIFVIILLTVSQAYAVRDVVTFYYEPFKMDGYQFHSTISNRAKAVLRRHCTNDRGAPGEVTFESDSWTESCKSSVDGECTFISVYMSCYVNRRPSARLD